MNGLLLVDKPQGWTSFDAVHKIRNVLQKGDTDNKKIKVGHAGTLDPNATGLLLVLIGEATKKAPDFTKLDKSYTGVMKLGWSSETDDEEGRKTVVSDKVPKEERLKTIMDAIKGKIEQMPPQYSAIKVNGKRSYHIARKGDHVHLQPRKVTIHKLQLTGYKYPLVSFTADVSSGTYIRSIARDIGESLGSGAYLQDLRRTKVGDFSVDKGISPEKITFELITKNIQPLE